MPSNLFSRGSKPGQEQKDHVSKTEPIRSQSGPGDRSSYVAPQPAVAPAIRRGTSIQLRLARIEDKTLADQYVFGNLCAVSTQDFPLPRDGSDLQLLLNGKNVITARPLNTFPQGCISMSDAQRTWCLVAIMDTVVCEMYDPFSQGSQVYLGALDVEVGFALSRKTTEEPYDQDHLAERIINQFLNQIFAPGQKLLISLNNIPLLLTVKEIQLVDLSTSKEGAKTTTPNARGILNSRTKITFYKDLKSPIRFKPSASRPADRSATLDPAFVEEFGWAICPKLLRFSPTIDTVLKEGGSIVNLVRKSVACSFFSVLLHGPPMTGKTALATQIAAESDFPFLKFISAEKMVGLSETAKIQHLLKVFTEAYEHSQNVIVIDSIERIVEWAPIGPKFSNAILHTLLILLTKRPLNLNRILVIGTTSEHTAMNLLGIQQVFDRELAVPNIETYGELEFVLREVRALSEPDLGKSLNKLKDTIGMEKVNMGIKKVLRSIEEAKQDEGDVAGRFAELMKLRKAKDQPQQRPDIYQPTFFS